MTNEQVINDRRVPTAFGFLLIILLLVGCAGEGGLVGIAATSPIATPPASTPSPLPDDATTAARIRARGSLVVGVRYDLRPFGYVTDEGELAGFDVDLGRELARRWLGDAEAAQFRQVRSDTAIEHLQAGDVDIAIAALTHTQAREAGADFSLPYFIDGQALLVTAADASAIRSPQDLQGRTIGVSKWNQARETIDAAVPFTLTLQAYDGFAAAATALGQGEVDAVADLRRRLFWGTRILAETETAIVGQYTTAPVAIAYPQNDPFFGDLLNLTLQEMVADGRYATLYTRWFAPESPPAIERWPGKEVPELPKAPARTGVPHTISAIESRGRLAVALAAERPPLAYIDADGRAAGYELDLVRHMAARWLGDAAAMDVLTTTLDTGRQLLRTGRVDLLIGALPHTRESELAVDFSLTTYVAGESLLVQAGTPITNVGSLNRRQIAVIEGSRSREVLLAAARDVGVSVTVLPRPSLEEAIASLEEGRVAGVAADRVDLLPALSRVEEEPELRVLSLRLTQVPLAIGLPPGDSAFRDLVNLTLQAMKADDQFANLYATWFDDAPPSWETWPGAPYRDLQFEVTASQEGEG